MPSSPNRRRLIVACVAVSMLKLALCAGMPLDVHAGAAYDDAWAVRAADFIAQGQWLGPYDDIALIKNPGFPLWLALCIRLGAGYLVPTALLYVLASAFFTAALRPLLQRDWLVLAMYALVLFCPVSFATDTFQRVYRNSITAAQALLVFGAYLGAYLRIVQPTDGVGRTCARARAVAPWMTVGALGLAWFWISREDSIWIAPFALVATVAMLVLVLRGKGTARALAGRTLCCALLVLPLLATLGAVQAVKAANQAAYGVGVTAEINSGNFARMVKDLYAIDPAQVPDMPYAVATADDDRGAEDASPPPSPVVEHALGGMPENLRVACTHAALLAAYEQAPTLGALRDAVEDEFLNWGDTVDNDPGDGEVNGGEFFWVLRRAARDAGVYELGAVEADAFYGQAADELEAAFAEGRLPQRATLPSSIMTPWRAEYATQLPGAFAGIYAQAASCADVTAEPFAAQGDAEGVAYFERMCGGSAYAQGDPAPLACSIGEGIVWAYRVLGSVLAVAGAPCALAMLVRWLRTRRDGPLVLVLTALLLGASVLIAGLAYSRVSSFVPIAYYYYGSAAYPLLLSFNALAAAAAARAIRSTRSRTVANAKQQTVNVQLTG